MRYASASTQKPSGIGKPACPRRARFAALGPNRSASAASADVDGTMSECIDILQVDLVCCPVDSYAKSLQFSKDRICGGSPDERFAIGIVIGYEMIDAFNQFADRTERTTTDGAACDKCKEALDQIQPRAVSRHEVQIPARTCGQPRLDLGMFG